MSIRAILGLEGWEVSEWKTPPGENRLVARYTITPSVCPKCGTFEPRLYVHAWKDQPFRDMSIHGKPTFVVVQRPRYKCRECGETFQQPLPDMDDRRFMTRRLVEWIGSRALRKTFADVANDVGVDEKTVRLIFAEHVKTLKDKHVFVTPKWLGMDELMLVRQLRCVLTNVEENAIYDLISARDRDAVVNRLMRIPHRERIELVAMDMWRPYKQAANAVLPQAVVVVDKFHVVRMASLCLDLVRKAVRGDLTPAQRRRLMHDRHILLTTSSKLRPDQILIREAWLNHFPRLRAAYEAKERFYGVYEARNRNEAVVRLTAWRDSLDRPTKTDFRMLLTAVGNWESEILTYFDYRVTNAYTEALNGLAKVINRQGRGYSFDAVRAKLLFSGEHRVSRPRFGRVAEGTAAFIGQDTYGVSIPNLTVALEASLNHVDSTHDSG